MTSNDDKRSDEATIARLLRKAGRGPTATADARQRVYNAVQAEWQHNVAALNTQQGSETAPQTKLAVNYRRWLLRGAPLAAALASAAVVFLVMRTTPPGEERVELASITKVVGTVGLIEPGMLGQEPLSAATGSLRVGDALSTGQDGAAALSLLDGISLRIDADSELLLAANDSVELRSGRIYLDTGAPTAMTNAVLEVETPLGVVWHRGTQYEVQVGNERLRVRVREGAVGVRDGVSEHNGAAGEQLLLGRDGALARSAIAISGPEWAWAERLASAPLGDQQQVLELLEWVARETGRELRFASDALAQTAQADTIFGIAGLTPDETLDAVAGTTALRYEATDEALLIY